MVDGGLEDTNEIVERWVIRFGGSSGCFSWISSEFGAVVDVAANVTMAFPGMQSG